MKKNIFLLSIILLLKLGQVERVNAQTFFELNSYKREKVDSTHILSFYNDLNIGILLGQKQAAISIADVEKESLLEYTPNTNSSIGLKATYKWLGFNLDFPVGLPAAKL
ncbi:MAG: hypothetical protein R6U85_07545 [Salinivirgaceae bacterium]